MTEQRRLVVKDHALTNAAYTLDLSEQRLILLSIVGTRQSSQGINAEQPLMVRAVDYAEQFKITRDAAYDALKDAASGLFDRYFSYKQLTEKGNIERVKSRWVSQVSYIEREGTVSILFAPAVVPLITRLERQFTSYELEQVSELTSTFAIRLYELLITWRSTGKTPEFPLAEFRSRLGVEEGTYKLMRHFKARVLDFAIKQINEHTDITASYKQHKQGRTISGFSFTFKLKQPAPNPNAIDMMTGTTDAEKARFRRKKITRKEAEGMARPGEMWPELIRRLSPDYLIEN